jgi:hypothetical protein
MAINIPIISEFSDAGVKAAKAAFANFKTAVGDAQGGMAKFKAGSTVAMDAVKANAGTLAMAGGAALADFAIKGVQAFQELALSAGKFADATGLSVEEASKFIEVAGDIGIEAGTVETAIGKLNKTIGADADKVRDLGVDLVYLADGALDVNATFLNTIQRIKDIKDPAEKAKVASQLLGKGWQSMSELIEMGSDDLQKSLDGVSEAKVINSEELKKAKELRDVIDVLKGKVEDLSLSIGGSLVPVLGDLGAVLDVGLDVRNVFKSIPGATWMSENLTPLALTKTALGGVADATGAVIGWFKDSPSTIEKFIDHMGEIDFKTSFLGKTIDSVRQNALPQFVTQIENATVAIVKADTAWKNLTGEFDQVVALDKATEALGRMEAAAEEAFATGAYDDLVTYNEKAAEFMDTLETIAGTMDGISSKEILFKFKTEGSAAALEYANYLARGAEYGGLSVEDALALAGISTGSNNTNGRFRGARANGGPVMGGSSYLVGERGPELFTPGTSGNITPNGAMGGNTITVNVNGGDPNEIVRALQAYNRNVGRLPVSVQ